VQVLRRLLFLLLSLVVLLGPLFLVNTSRPVATICTPLADKVIAVDPGHGGVDPGAIGPDGLLEKDIVLDIALRLRTLLQSAGATVVMTRETDIDLSDAALGRQYSKRKRQDLQRRVKLINDSNARVLISIHVNSMASARWSGAQVFYHQDAPESRRLAETIQYVLREHLQNTTRQIATGDFYITRVSACTAVLVEVGFISNPTEARLLASADYRAQLAAAIFGGLLHYWHQP